MDGRPTSDGRRDVQVRDVTPRDGLQAEAPVPVEARARLARGLARAGLAEVEVVSFVSPAAVPSMAGAGDVLGGVGSLTGVTWWALVPNARGAELALAAGADHLTITVSASDGYSRKNVGRSTAEALAGLAGIAGVIGDGAALDVVVSCAFGSPFDDVAGPEAVHTVVADVLESVPGARVTLADTTGTATPRRLAAVLTGLPRAARPDLGLHLHDTRGTALANALWALDEGIVRFDTALGGLGGSPFAPGAGGNLATEQLVLVLDDLGVRTGIDLDALWPLTRDLPELVGHDLPSRVARAGPLPRFAG